MTQAGPPRDPESGGAVAPAPPPSQLRQPLNRVSPRARWVWTGEAVLVVVVPTVLLILATQVWDWWALAAWQVVIWAVLVAAYVIGMPLWRWRVHRWEVTETAVYTQRGWLDVERRIAPLSRVQTVDVHRGPLSQLFRLSTVTVTTASAAGALRIEGLDVDLAARIVDEITIRTAAEKGDAT